MKAQNITIDINRLDTDQLKLLAEMIWKTDAGTASDLKSINDRSAFLLGYMSEKMEAEYVEMYC